MALKGDPYMRVCGVVRAPGLDEMREAALRARAGIVELRLDSLRDPPPSAAAGDVGAIVGELRKAGRRVVVTLRDSSEGGGYRGSPGEKARILLRVAEHAPDYVDVEIGSPAFDLVAGPALSTGVGVVASLHRLDGPLPAGQILSIARWVAGYAEEAGRPGAALAKVVYACRSPADEIHAMQAVAAAPGRIVSFAVGPGCVLSRIAAPLLGAPFTYAHEHGGPAAPGQPSVEEVVRLWRLMGVA